MSKPLQFIPLYNKIFEDPEWRRKSMFARGVFYELLVLSGANGRDGFIPGSDEAIARMLNVRVNDFKRAVADLTPSLERVEADMTTTPRRPLAGLKLSNWARYQRVRKTEIEIEIDTETETETTLRDLPENLVWWNKLAKEFPGVDLAFEHAKALDWPGASRVKNVKNFFRNWVHRAAKDYATDNIVHLPNLDLGEKAIVG